METIYNIIEYKKKMLVFVIQHLSVKMKRFSNKKQPITDLAESIDKVCMKISRKLWICIKGSFILGL